VYGAVVWWTIPQEVKRLTNSPLLSEMTAFKVRPVWFSAWVRNVRKWVKVLDLRGIG
jgi:hypothetical protein